MRKHSPFKKNFIDYVSHELRTPITALLGTLEVTSSRPRSIEVHEEAIRQLKQYTSDLQETLDQMMLLSGAKTSFEFREVRVDEIVWQVIENMILYHQAQVEVEILVKDNALLMTEGNDKLLELAINNILENAVKYSDNKPIKVTLSECDGRLIVSVLDQGIGIPQDDLHHIKDNFSGLKIRKGFRVKASVYPWRISFFRCITYNYRSTQGRTVHASICYSNQILIYLRNPLNLLRLVLSQKMNIR